MKIRLMRGQVVIREIGFQKSSIFWTPEEQQRQQKTHQGKVLAMGPPMMYKDHEISHGFSVGDTVVYHFTTHKDAATRAWIDGKDATWIPQWNVDAVIDD